MPEINLEADAELAAHRSQFKSLWALADAAEQQSSSSPARPGMGVAQDG